MSLLLKFLCIKIIIHEKEKEIYIYFTKVCVNKFSVKPSSQYSYTFVLGLGADVIATKTVEKR